MAVLIDGENGIGIKNVGISEVEKMNREQKDIISQVNGTVITLT